MALVMPKQVHHNSNGHNIDQNVRVLAKAPRRASPNADNARWHEIELGRMTFIMRVGKSTPLFSWFIVRCPLSIAAIIFLFNHFLRHTHFFLRIALYINTS